VTSRLERVRECTSPKSREKISIALCLKFIIKSDWNAANDGLRHNYRRDRPIPEVNSNQPELSRDSRLWAG